MQRRTATAPPSRPVIAVVLALLMIVTAAPARAQESDLTRYESLARDLLAELIEINTTQSAGDMTAAAEAMKARLLAAGFPESDVVVLEPVARKGNLVARLRGRSGAKKPILLLAHIDVVEANPEDWTLPPFEFIERDGIFYGRGVADDKDEAAIHITNLIRMKEEGFVPDRDIIVALTTDEEGGPDNGVQWLVENERDMIDASFAINEGGGGVVENGKKVSNSVQASEKKYQDFTVEATNPGGHSSLPRPDNAIYDLATALLRIGEHTFPVRLNEVTRAHFERSAGKVSPELGAAMRAVLADPNDGGAVATLSRVPRYNSMLRTTCVATLLEGGHAANALPQRATANVNCRMLPDARPEDVQRELERVAGDRVTIEMVSRAVDSPPSPLTPEVMTAITDVTEQLWPGVDVVPTMSTGATDGLYLRNAGIPVYGVSGLFYDETFAHGMNERVPARAFYDGLEFLYRLVKVLSSPGTT